MQFVVRYWSSLLTKEFRDGDGTPQLVDYSIHPPTRLGLHNALLSHHDRMEILAAHGGEYKCEVLVMEEGNAQVLTQEMAIGLFYSLPHGEVKWTTIREFLLPDNRRELHAQVTQAATHERQLQLFEYTHVPYDDTEPPHHLDIDV